VPRSARRRGQGMAEAGMQGQRFSIVIPTYQRRDVLVETMHALARLETPWPCELLVVVDGSTDGSAEAARAVPVPFPVRVLEQDNRGGCRPQPRRGRGPRRGPALPGRRHGGRPGAAGRTRRGPPAGRRRRDRAHPAAPGLPAHPPQQRGGAVGARAARAIAADPGPAVPRRPAHGAALRAPRRVRAGRRLRRVVQRTRGVRRRGHRLPAPAPAQRGPRCATRQVR
jgi:hypothetical protein